MHTTPLIENLNIQAKPFFQGRGPDSETENDLSVLTHKTFGTDVLPNMVKSDQISISDCVVILRWRKLSV